MSLDEKWVELEAENELSVLVAIVVVPESNNRPRCPSHSAKGLCL